MKALNKSSEAIFAKLISGLDVGRSHKLDNAPGTFLPVHVERLSDSTYSVAHYFEQGGDMMADPDVVFYVPVEARYGSATAGSQVYPVEITQAPVGIYRRYVEFDETGQPAHINARGQADLTSFANTWMRNIRAQQMTGRQNMREQNELTGPGTDGLYRYRGATIELSSAGTRHWWATVRFRSQEIDFEARSSDEALEKAKEWINSAPEFRGRHTPAPDDYGKPYPREPSGDDNGDEVEVWIDASDNEAPWLAQHWYSGQGDPLYALSSTGFPQPESTISWALSNAKKSENEQWAYIEKTYGKKGAQKLMAIDSQSREARSLPNEKREDLEATDEIGRLVWALQEALDHGERISEEEGLSRQGVAPGTRW